ncbi:MAG: DUF1223 domain-containing protein [Kofleriaceae bacterium]
MRPWILACALAAACTSARSEPTSSAAGSAAVPPTGPVVIELFTSQGCSSCPPADRLMSRLVADGKLAGRPVIPLSFHVDYWNYLGWADPFSTAEWTQRQRTYAAALSERGVYTPQAVVAGRAHAVGSRRDQLAKLIAETPTTTALPVETTWSGESVQVRVPAGAPAGAELWLAVWQNGLRTAVKRGENRGEALRNDHVVRRLARLSDGAATVRLDPSWKDLGGVVFAQRTADRAVIAAGVLPAPAKRPSGK